MNKTDYNKLFEEITSNLGEKKPELLLHVCCAVCLAAALPLLDGHYKLTLYFYNPNISPKAEYDKRANEVKKLISGMGIDCEYIIAPYDRNEYNDYLGNKKGGREHGEKCALCLEQRIMAAAKKAAELSCEYFTTTLTSSPLKDAEYINQKAKEAGAVCGVKNLPTDFKKKGGNLRIKELCEKYNIYRQNYCGCTPPRFIVVVTGGIGSGKSTLVGILKEEGAYTLEADKITHELQREGEPVNEEIKTAFPEAVKNGVLDRQILKRIVFDDKEKLKELENIVQPAVKRELIRRAYAADAEIIVLEIPQYYESGADVKADVVVNVEADVRERIRRTMQRDGISHELCEKIMSKQLSDEERRKLADITIVTDNNIANLRNKAKELMSQWRENLK